MYDLDFLKKYNKKKKKKDLPYNTASAAI